MRRVLLIFALRSNVLGRLQLGNVREFFVFCFKDSPVDWDEGHSLRDACGSIRSRNVSVVVVVVELNLINKQHEGIAYR